MIRAGKFIVSSIMAVAIATAPVVAHAEEDCFQRKDNQNLAFDVFQISAPPSFSASANDYAEAYRAYPASDYAAASVRQLRQEIVPSASGLKFRKHYLLWANRCVFVRGLTPNEEACRNTKRPKGNGYPNMVGGPLSSQLRTLYSTYEKANMCTLLGAMSLLGEKEEDIAAGARAAGLTLVPSTTDRTELTNLSQSVLAGLGPDAVKTTALVDVCVVESEKLSRETAGIVLDYEVFDNRTPVEALTFFRELHEVVKKHGKTLVINTNPLPREPNGINASNVRDILNVVDGFVPTISTGASPGNPDTSLARQSRKVTPIDSYKLQLGVLTDNGRSSLTQSMKRKLIWNISLFDTELSEARQLRQEVISQGYRGIMIFRNFVKQGGACSRSANQVTACLAFGECDGRFGVGR